MPLGTLETMADWNELLACCCPMPLCPIPVKVCESLNAHFQSVGFINTADLTFKLHKKRGWTGEWADTETILVEDVDPSVDGETAASYTIDLSTFFGQVYDILYDGGIGNGGGGCPNYEPVVSDECTAVGTSNRQSFYTFGYSTGEFPDIEYHVVNGLGFEESGVVEDVSGEETEEHIAWDAEFSAAIAAWNAAHPSGPTWQEANTTHTTWQGVADTRTAWETNRDAWVAEDPGSRLPEEYAEAMSDPEPPEAGTEPETTGIDDEPTENYPECWFKVVLTSIWYPYFFDGYGVVPGVPDPTDTVAFDAWAESSSGDPPAPGTLVQNVYGSWSSVPSMLNPGGLSSSYSESYGFPDPPEPVDYAAWVAEVLDLIAAQVTFPKPGCIGTGCESSYAVTDAPPASPPASDAYDDIILDATDARYRWQIPPMWNDQFTGLPTTFTGNYFKITWNVVEEPTGWNDTIDDPDYVPPEEEPEGGFPPVPQVPKPGRPSRSFIPFPDAEEGADPNDWIWEWTGPGVPATPESWLSEWFLFGIPTVPGRRYVANVRFICQPDSPWGTLPQVTGPAVDIPPPEEP